MRDTARYQAGEEQQPRNPDWRMGLGQPAEGTASVLVLEAKVAKTEQSTVPPSADCRGLYDRQRTGSIKCSYAVPGHITYGFVGSAFGSRG